MIPEPDQIPPRIRETIKALRKQSRAVTGNEIAAYAKKDCRWCWGKGVLKVNAVPTACGCAMNAFKKANEGKFRVLPGGMAEWLPPAEVKEATSAVTQLRPPPLPWYRRWLRALFGPRTTHA